MKTKQYRVTLAGISPMLMHADNLDWADAMKAWLREADNKANSDAGDDRTPGFKWIGNLYHNDGVVALPSDNIMTMLREGGAKTPTGKGKGSFKRQTQSGLIVDQIAWPVLVNGKEISMAPIEELKTEKDFSIHQSSISKIGFELFVKRVRMPNGSKHVRVRPLFRSWEVTGSITVLDETITGEILGRILSYGGALAGLCDWRPSSPKSPGPFGKFEAQIEEIA